MSDLKDRILKANIRRIQKESEGQDRLKHTIYLGDRTIQRLGQEPIENGDKLNNAAVAIGDPMMPLATGNAVQRVDNFNISNGTGTARRTVLERDGRRNGRSNGLGENGDPLPPNDPTLGTPKRTNPLPKKYPPPNGCISFNPQRCVWLNTPEPPIGYEKHGSAVLNEDGLELFLYCENGVVPPPNLGCDFLNRWKCQGGVCIQDPNGIYPSQEACQMALIPPEFSGGQSIGIGYVIEVMYSFDPSWGLGYTTKYGRINTTGSQLTPYTDAELYALVPVSGAITQAFLGGFVTSSERSVIVNGGGGSTGSTITPFAFGYIPSVKISRILRKDGLPDTGGNPPSTCP